VKTKFSKDGERLWYIPWFYEKWRHSVLFHVPLDEVLGVEKPGPDNDYADILNRIRVGCLNAEIEVKKTKKDFILTRPLGSL
jgi:hypothetical protein